MVTTNNMEEKTVRIKIISLGAAEVGKSCLIKRYCEKRFVSKYMATLGIDFGVTEVTVNDRTVKVNIFDMGGLPFFYEVRNEFYKHTQGVVLVYDVSNRDSFEVLNNWLSEMKQHLISPQDFDNIVVVVCANKTDVNRWQVDESEGRLFAETRGFLFYQTSAQTGDNVVAMFEDLFSKVVRVQTTGSKAIVQPKTSYTQEQAELVQRIRSCSSSYGILELSSQRLLTRDDIIKAFKHLAIQLHPDKNAAPGSEEAFKLVSHAKDELLKTL